MASGAIPSTPGAIPSTPGAIPSTPGAIPSTPGAIPATPSKSGHKARAPPSGDADLPPPASKDKVEDEEEID